MSSDRSRSNEKEAILPPERQPRFVNRNASDERPYTGVVKRKARTANGGHETVLVKGMLRAIVVSLSIAMLISSVDVASAGPLPRFL